MVILVIIPVFNPVLSQLMLTNSPQNQGKEGYCNFFDRESRPGEESFPTVDKNWGTCTTWCGHDNFQNLSTVAFGGPSRKLRETAMDFISTDICEYLNGHLGFNRTKEFCVGHKKYFPKMKVFYSTGKYSIACI